jgi:hypothetical protein
VVRLWFLRQDFLLGSEENGYDGWTQLIGVLCLAVEFRQLDIYTEVSFLLSQHLALPRIGHLVAVYLQKYPMSSFIFDPTNPVPVTPTRAKPDWSAFYSESEEELPPRMPEPLGNQLISMSWSVLTMRECCHMLFPCWHLDFTSELTHPLDKSETDFSWNVNVW